MFLGLGSRRTLYLEKLFPAQTSIKWLLSLLVRMPMLISIDLSFLMMNKKQWTKSSGDTIPFVLFFQNVFNFGRQLSLKIFKNSFIHYCIQIFLWVIIFSIALGNFTFKLNIQWKLLKISLRWFFLSSLFSQESNIM